MIFDGHRWRISYNIVTLPTENTACLVFGRMAAAHAKGAYLTNWTFANNNRFGKKNGRIWAVPLPVTGWSLTNVAYGKPTRQHMTGGWMVYRQPMYLKKDGYCYTHSHEISEAVYKAGIANCKAKAGEWMKDVVNLSQGGANE